MEGQVIAYMRQEAEVMFLNLTPILDPLKKNGSSTLNTPAGRNRRSTLYTMFEHVLAALIMRHLYSLYASISPIIFCLKRRSLVFTAIENRACHASQKRALSISRLLLHPNRDNG